MRSLLRKALAGAASPAAATTGAPQQAAASAPPASAPPVEPAGWSELGDWMVDEDYRSFQDRFRGDPESITERMRAHVERFDGVAGTVADLGCGRGEFLDLLRDAGVATPSA